MPNWQITATTIYCNAVEDNVTIMVYSDWRTACTGYSRYAEKFNKEVAELLHKKGEKTGKTLKCEGPQDFRVIEYKNKLLSEEKDI